MRVPTRRDRRCHTTSPPRASSSSVKGSPRSESSAASAAPGSTRTSRARPVTSQVPPGTPKARLLTIRESEDPATLVAQLGDVGLHEAVLFPSSDLWAQAVSRLSDRRAGSLPELDSPSPADVLDDPRRQGALRADAGAARGTTSEHPGHRRRPRPTRACGSERVLPEAESLAAVQPCLGRQGDQLRHSRRSARRRARAWRRRASTRLLQEYIPGPTSCHYFVDGFVDAGGAAARALRASASTACTRPTTGTAP